MEALDDELDAVSGGVLWCLFSGEYASDGKGVGCFATDYSDWAEANYKICPKSAAGHDWEEVRKYYDGPGKYIDLRCKLCGYETKKLINYYVE